MTSYERELKILDLLQKLSEVGQTMNESIKVLGQIAVNLNERIEKLEEK